MEELGELLVCVNEWMEWIKASLVRFGLIESHVSTTTSGFLSIMNNR